MKRPIKQTFSAGGNEISYKIYCNEDGAWCLHCSAFDIMDLSLETSCSSIAKEKAFSVMLDTYEKLTQSFKS